MLTSLAGSYYDLRRFEKAIDCQQQALAISREIGDRLGEGVALINLGAISNNLRRLHEAGGALIRKSGGHDAARKKESRTQGRLPPTMGILR